MPEKAPKRVAIIGAGIAGLGAVKTCLEYGLEPVCFDKRNEIGGLWSKPGPHPEYLKVAGQFYPGLILNDFKTYFAYSDFPWPKDSPFLVMGENVALYLHAYAKQFNLFPSFRLNTEVLKVQKADSYDRDGRWTVTTVSANPTTEPRVTTTETFDAVMICSGFFTKRQQPSFPGEESYTGTVTHSGQFCNPEAYKNQTVAIVGGSISAVDLACTLSRTAKKVYLISREGIWVVPLFLRANLPYEDYAYNRALNTCLTKKKQREQWETKIGKRYNHGLLGLAPDKPFLRGQLGVSGEIDQWIYAGKLKPIINVEIQKYTGEKKIKLSNDETVEADHVIYATGFRCPCDYFAERDMFQEDEAERNWWFYFFPLNQRHPTLFAIGLFFSTGSSIPIFELQCRAACGIISGQLLLPKKEQMALEVQQEKERVLRTRGKFPARIHPLQYSMDLSKFIGCYPNMLAITKRSPSLAWQSWFGPVTPFHYRLFGPHSDFRAAKKAITEELEDRYSQTKLPWKIMHD